MSDLPNLVWLRAFESSARLRSFTAAATELNLTQAAVSHQVRSLEKSFGVALFIRRARVLELTALGHAYYPSVSQALDDIAYSTRGLLGRSQPRMVTLRAPISTAVLCIAPVLADFHLTHPDIKIRLISEVWADSTSEEDVDIDLRLGSLNQFARQAHLLSQETVLPVALPETAADLHDLSDLSTHSLIHIHGFQDNWLRLSQEYGLDFSDAQPSLYVDTSLAAIELAAAGAGAAMIMRRYAVRALNSRRLAPLGDAELQMGQGPFLRPTQGHRPAQAEVSRVRDWIVDLLSAP